MLGEGLWRISAALRLPPLPDPEVLVAAVCVGLCGASAITSGAALAGLGYLAAHCGCAP